MHNAMDSISNTASYSIMMLLFYLVYNRQMNKFDRFAKNLGYKELFKNSLTQFIYRSLLILLALFGMFTSFGIIYLDVVKVATALVNVKYDEYKMALLIPVIALVFATIKLMINCIVTVFKDICRVRKFLIVNQEYANPPMGLAREVKTKDDQSVKNDL